MTHVLIGAIERLTINIPAACKVLHEEGYHILADALKDDANILAQWNQAPEEETVVWVDGWHFNNLR